MKGLRVGALGVWLLVMAGGYATPPAPATAQINDYVLDACHFRITDPSYHGGGEVDNKSSKHAFIYTANFNPTYDQSFETSMSFLCEKADDTKRISDFSGVLKVEGGWALDNSEPPLPGEDRQLILYHAKNAEGAGVAENDATGDEDTRVRTLSFCLIRRGVALCGGARPIMFVNDPKSSVQDKVVALIDSIEFIDDAPNDGDHHVP
jgi:hypothetical protein